MEFVGIRNFSMKSLRHMCGKNLLKESKVLLSNEQDYERDALTLVDWTCREDGRIKE